jgi:molybdenum storage protein
MIEPTMNSDKRHHLNSLLMRESLLDKDLQKSTEEQSKEAPIIRMLPNTHVIKIGGRSILDAGRSVTYPVVEALATLLEDKKLIIGTGGGARTRHVFSIGIDLGMPSGILAQLAQADALGNAHILGALLSPYGVVAIPPEMFGHLLPLFIRSVPGVIFTGVPPYSLWEHPPEIGRIPPHGSDAGCLMLAECFGCETVTLVKDVDGLYDCDPKKYSNANYISDISTTELRQRNLETLPFEPILINLLENSRLVHKFQIVNGQKPERIIEAVNGKQVGTIIYKG